MSSADTEEQQEQAPEVDTLRESVLEELTAALGDAIVEFHIQAGDLWVRVRRDDWRRAVEACKSIGFDYFDFLSGLDWMPSAPNPEDAETLSVEPEADADEARDPEEAAEAEAEHDAEPQPSEAGTVAAYETAGGEPESGWVTGVAGGDTRFQVFARFHSPRRGLGITLKADLDDESPAVASIHDIFFGAEWHERETWEMYGFAFEGHPDLRHIYLPGEFEGFPLRKDFPLLAREVKPWPGIVDVEDLPAAEEARQDAVINAAQEDAPSEGAS
ncbi:MAG TPA: NADH-quinone oxidoreductase subunit C [Acidimicrobiales bacterium]|nr:NADH-quinone oxidoreductase subunit C [Acidimicrobiales bacterium]